MQRINRTGRRTLIAMGAIAAAFVLLWLAGLTGASR